MSTRAPLTIAERHALRETRLSPAKRGRLVRKARRLAWLGNLWHVAEFAIAVGAGIAAGSIALIGFGVDSLVEAAAGGIVLWRLSARRVDSASAERRAQQLVSVSYFLLAVYVGVESIRAFLDGSHPQVSPIGIGLAAFTLVTMPLLALAKRRVGIALGSRATAGEGTQNMLCAYLSAALLVGLTANALFGWWWADPGAAMLIGVVAVKEGVALWRGEDCCDPTAGASAEATCEEHCC